MTSNFIILTLPVKDPVYPDHVSTVIPSVGPDLDLNHHNQINSLELTNSINNNPTSNTTSTQDTSNDRAGDIAHQMGITEILTEADIPVLSHCHVSAASVDEKLSIVVNSGDIENSARTGCTLDADTIESSLKKRGPEQDAPITIGYKQQRIRLIHFVTLCWCIFIEGFNDGSTGPLLPVIQADYRLSYSIVSLLFVANCIGFLSGAFMNVWMNERFGFGKVIAIGAITHLCMYVILSPSPSFPAMVVAFAIGGFGMSLQNSQASGFVANLKTDDVHLKLGILYATYGLGAFTSPFIATVFSEEVHWSYHYLVLACLSFSNVLALLLVFQLKPMATLHAEAGQDSTSKNEEDVQRSVYKQILGIRAVHFLTLFAFVYIGVEVTVGGWIVTFIIDKRDGGHSAGFISSGFFGGLTLGRIGLIWLNKLVGERRILFIYCFLSIALELTIWFVPSKIENAVAVSLVGVLLGPMYPIIVSQASQVIPTSLLTASVGWITGIGVAGSAALPLITGLLSSRFGIEALHPWVVSMMCTMAVLWACVPREVKQVEQVSS